MYRTGLFYCFLSRLVSCGIYANKKASHKEGFIWIHLRAVGALFSPMVSAGDGWTVGNSLSGLYLRNHMIGDVGVQRHGVTLI